MDVFNTDNPLDKLIEHIQVVRNKSFDEAVLGEITKMATEHGIFTEVALNEKAIVHALSNAIPSKPHPLRMDDLTYGYSCPACIMSVDESDKYCNNCGKKLDWSDEKDG